MSVPSIAAFTLRLADAPLDADCLASLISLRVEQRLSLPAQCELVFRLHPGTAPSAIALGAQLRIEADAQLLFAGELTAIEFVHGPSRAEELRVRAYDLLHRLRKRGAPRALSGVSQLELVQAVVEPYGLSVSAPDSTFRWAYSMQGRECDFDFLVRTTRQAGLYFVLRDRGLTVGDLGGDGEPIALSLGENLFEACVELNAEQAVSSVLASGWDLALSRPLQGEASVARSGRKVSATVTSEQVGGEPRRALVGALGATSEQVEARAQAELDRCAASAIVLRGCAQGNARLSPFTRVSLHGLSQSTSGQFVLTRVVHTLDAEHGFVSELSSEPPGVVCKSLATSTWLGVVTNVDDPRNAGRVRVRLPALDDLESDWLQTLSPAPGFKKGLRVLPDVDDAVLVRIEGDDPTRAIVLGGLQGEQEGADPAVAQGAVKRFSLLSSSGHLIQLDDADDRLTIRDGQGSLLEFDKAGVRLVSKVPLVIEAPGQSVTLRGKSIDFEQA